MNDEIKISKTSAGNYLVQIWFQDASVDEAEFVSPVDALLWAKTYLADMVP